ncbi:hypothetical protein ACFSTC_01750 [Nonomuraea ferruginea]
MSYLEAENAYLEQETSHLTELRERIFQEIKGRTQETDLSVPSRKGAWWYFTRTEEGKQYAVSCRVPADSETPPDITVGERLDHEQTLLDGNELARRQPVLLHGHQRRLPRRHDARLLDRLHRRRAVHAPVQGPADR